MRRLAWCFVVAITLCGRVTAQNRPDLSGTWRAPSSLLTIKQDATTLTVTKGSDTRTYNLDGSTSRIEGPRSVQTAQVRWAQSALVIEMSTVSSVGSWTDLQVYSLDHGSTFGDPKLSVVYVFTRETSPMMGTEVTTYTRD